MGVEDPYAVSPARAVGGGQTAADRCPQRVVEFVDGSAGAAPVSPAAAPVVNAVATSSTPVNVGPFGCAGCA